MEAERCQNQTRERKPSSAKELLLTDLSLMQSLYSGCVSILADLAMAVTCEASFAMSAKIAAAVEWYSRAVVRAALWGSTVTCVVGSAATEPVDRMQDSTRYTVSLLGYESFETKIGDAKWRP